MMMQDKFCILLADDDECLLLTTPAIIRMSGKHYQVDTANSVAQAKSLIKEISYDLVISDLNFEGQELDGNALIEWLADQAPTLPVVVMSGDNNTRRIVVATSQKNKIEFVVKGSAKTEADLMTAIKKAEHLKNIQSQGNKPKFLTTCDEIKKFLKITEKENFKNGGFSILITGESGTGKEELAKYIAQTLGKKMVSANMGAIPKDTAESQLFGHKKGAFTGAIEGQCGLIKSAHGGVFFLDEIGEASLDIQVKLLRVIQEKIVQPVGSVTPCTVDVRFIAATNRDLNELCEKGDFREDLLNRINAFPFRIPALRERPGDILLYANLFLDEKFGDKGGYTLEKEAADLLLNFSWPGNVRQLANIIERIYIFSKSSIINAETVTLAFAQSASCGSDNEKKPAADTVQYSHIITALERSNGNRTLAAKMLNISRNTLRAKIGRFKLDQFLSNGAGRPKGAQLVTE